MLVCFIQLLHTFREAVPGNLILMTQLTEYSRKLTVALKFAISYYFSLKSPLPNFKSCVVFYVDFSDSLDCRLPTAPHGSQWYCFVSIIVSYPVMHRLTDKAERNAESFALGINGPLELLQPQLSFQGQEKLTWRTARWSHTGKNIARSFKGSGNPFPTIWWKKKKLGSIPIRKFLNIFTYYFK